MMLRQVQYFHAVVQTGSFTEAAEECFISQSAISQQIKALENDLGVKLLVRENRSFHLTEAGEYLYQKSGQLLEDFERIKKETIQIGCGSQNTLRLGYLKSYSGKELLHAVSEYNDNQRRVFSDKYVNFNLFEASYFIMIHEKHPMSSNPFFEPQMLNEIPISNCVKRTAGGGTGLLSKCFGVRQFVYFC